MPNWKILLPGVLVTWGFIATMFFKSLLVYVIQIMAIEGLLLVYIHLTVHPVRFGQRGHLFAAMSLTAAGIAALLPITEEISRFPLMSVDGPVSTNYSALLWALTGGVLWYGGFVETVRFLFAPDEEGLSP